MYEEQTACQFCFKDLKHWHLVVDSHVLCVVASKTTQSHTVWRNQSIHFDNVSYAHPEATKVDMLQQHA